jgi:hypothetical protein
LLDLLCSKGADLNERDSFNQSPLFYAARDGQAECIARMIELDANVNQKDKVNETALFYAAREGKAKVCEILLQNGADVNVVDDKKQTALYFAKKHNHHETINLLIANGAYNTKDGKLKASDISKLERQKKAGILPGSSYRSGQGNNSVSSRGQKSAHNSLSQIKKVQNNSQKGGRVGDDVKLGYKLVFTDKTLNSKDISEEDFKLFTSEFPQIAEFLLKPEKLTSDQELMEKIQLDNWQTTALHIMATLWKIKGANVFHVPVNPQKLGIFDQEKANLKGSRIT